MKTQIGKLTNALAKITDLTSGDKSLPGVLLSISDNLLYLRYSDGHKSITEEISVETDDTDRMGDAVVSYEQFSRAIANCQPSGIIKVDEVELKFKDDNIISISADQNLDVMDDNGEVIGNKKMASKSMDLKWKKPDDDMKSKILTRMNYDSIFEGDNADEFERKELINELNKTAVEKGKLIYMSNMQSVFVANQAHVTSVPIPGYEVDEDRLKEIEEQLKSNGEYSEETYNKAVSQYTNRLHYPMCIAQSVAKSLANILSKLTSERVYLFVKDKHCNIFVDNEDEKVGVWFEMPKANKVHLDTLKSYESLTYKTYQINFLREFLESNIKSAFSATKSEKVAIEFTKVDNELGLNIVASSSQASIKDNYRVVVDDIVDPNNDIETKKFNVSLKVLVDMLSQLKTLYVAMDININENGVTCLRLAEIDHEKLANEYAKARQITEQLCKEQGIEFNAARTPTPAELKLNYRNNTLLTKQYCLLTK